VAGSPYVIDYRGSFLLDATPAEVWQSIEHGERFEGWWAWLREFRFDGPGLQDGVVLHGMVSPPVPYRMRVTVVLDRCVPPRSIDATVHGDLEGTAHLTLDAEAGATRAEVAWSIEMMQRPMRVAARLAPGVLRWGHDRVVEATVAGFRRHLAAPGGRQAG
jgi:carbon monoxide dehydrogenase subunit G